MQTVFKRWATQLSLRIVVLQQTRIYIALILLSVSMRQQQQQPRQKHQCWRDGEFVSENVDVSDFIGALLMVSPVIMRFS